MKFHLKTVREKKEGNSKVNTDWGLVPVWKCAEHREGMIYRIRGGKAGGMEGWKCRMSWGTALMEEVALELREGEVKECKGGGKVKND